MRGFVSLSALIPSRENVGKSLFDGRKQGAETRPGAAAAQRSMTIITSAANSLGKHCKTDLSQHQQNGNPASNFRNSQSSLPCGLLNPHTFKAGVLLLPGQRRPQTWSERRSELRSLRADPTPASSRVGRMGVSALAPSWRTLAWQGAWGRALGDTGSCRHCTCQEWPPHPPRTGKCHGLLKQASFGSQARVLAVLHYGRAAVTSFPLPVPPALPGPPSLTSTRPGSQRHIISPWDSLPSGCNSCLQGDRVAVKGFPRRSSGPGNRLSGDINSVPHRRPHPFGAL